MTGCKLLGLQTVRGPKGILAEKKKQYLKSITEKLFLGGVCYFTNRIPTLIKKSSKYI
jgi:hypothetical protein